MEPDPDTGHLVRVKPRSISGDEGAAQVLSDLTGAPRDACAERIADFLLGAGRCERDPVTGFPPFAFRLHQFISRGDAVYASLERGADRYLTTNAQQYVPGSRDKVLFPLAFCRECGQEYYVVRCLEGPNGGQVFTPRLVSERINKEDRTAGFLYLDGSNPWPKDEDAVMDRLPEDWIQATDGDRRVRRDRVKWLPRAVHVLPNGLISDAEAARGAAEGATARGAAEGVVPGAGAAGRATDHGVATGGVTGEGINATSADPVACHYLPAPFRFCLSCGVSYAGRTGDFVKLGQLGSEGRARPPPSWVWRPSAPARRHDLPRAQAPQLHRQSPGRFAAGRPLQRFRGGWPLRSALYRAVEAAGEAGIRHDLLTQKVFEALDLPWSGTPWIPPSSTPPSPARRLRCAK